MKKIKQYSFVLLVCFSYQFGRMVYKIPTMVDTKPIEDSILHFCKDVLKAIDPKSLFKDVGDDTNDLVKTSKIKNND